MAASTFHNSSSENVRIVSASLLRPDNLDQLGSLALGGSFNADLFPVPVADGDDRVLADVWRDRIPLRNESVLPGHDLQLGVLVRKRAGVKRATAGAVEVTYFSGEEQYRVDGTITYLVVDGSC